MRSTFEVTQDAGLNLFQNELGIGNGINISDEQLNINMHEVQRRNHLPETDIEDGMRSFCIEMETGTGKTYVYTKTIF